jgi:DNA-binding beta-propeller fold protein YncE
VADVCRPITGYTHVTSWGSLGSGNNQFRNPKGIAVDSDGNVYVGDSRGVKKFDSAGRFLENWEPEGIHVFSSPRQIAVDRAGDVYVTDIGLYLRVFDPSGNVLRSINEAGHGIAVDDAGTTFVASAEFHFGSTHHSILKFDSTGRLIGELDNIGALCLAVDGSGHLFGTAGVQNFSATAGVRKYDYAGNLLAEWGGSGVGRITYAEGIAIDASANVYVVDYLGHCLKKYDSNGVYLTTVGSSGSGPGQFAFPQQVAVDGSGNLYVTDRDNHRVQKFAPVASPLPPRELAASDARSPEFRAENSAGRHPQRSGRDPSGGLARGRKRGSGQRLRRRRGRRQP